MIDVGAPVLPITELGVIGHPERAERREDAAVDRRDVHKTALVKEAHVTLGCIFVKRKVTTPGQKCRSVMESWAGW